MSARRHVMVAFDAFGTIVSPKKSIGLQYAEVADQFGFKGVESKEVARHFKKAFNAISAQYPNYRVHQGSEESGVTNSREWWKRVIDETFHPIRQSPPFQSVSDAQMAELTSELWSRFSTAEGYLLHDDAMKLIRALYQRRRRSQNQNQNQNQNQSQPSAAAANNNKLFVGVISNSDARMVPVLSSLGIRVGAPTDTSHLQFVGLSQDLGVAKPDRRIFDLAEKLVRDDLLPPDQATDAITKIHIGDSLTKDVRGANRAGWHTVFLDRLADGHSYKDAISPIEFIDRFIVNQEEDEGQGPKTLQVASLWPES
jgi:FMN phosphatase YigB (HAD superfamily)